MATWLAGRQKILMHPAAKPLIFGICLLPFAWLFYRAFNDLLGANPAEALIRALGDWTLRFLCIVLAVTPLRVITKTPALARFRRMLGLFVYFYVVLHLLSYSWFDMGLLHFFWMRAGKNNFAEVFVYAAIVAVLLGWRVWNAWTKSRRQKMAFSAAMGAR